MVDEGRAAYMGLGSEQDPGATQNILPYIILCTFREVWEYVREISWSIQGSKCARVWEPC